MARTFHQGYSLDVGFLFYHGDSPSFIAANEIDLNGKRWMGSMGTILARYISSAFSASGLEDKNGTN